MRSIRAMTVVQKRGQTTIQDFFGLKAVKKAKTTIKSDAFDKDTLIKQTVEKKEVDDHVGLEQTSTSLLSHNSVKEDFKKSLSPHNCEILDLELTTLEDSWFLHLEKEFTKTYFLQLKEFVIKEQKNSTVFPPPKDIYSWSHHSPFDKVKIVIIGQDPYHNFNQAHGLAFSVKKPTPAPPSLKNIYKELKNNYSDFEVDNKCGDLTNWADQGVLLLNTALTVRAHNANSHSKHGWEEFTAKIVEILLKDRVANNKPLVFLLWGNNAIKLVDKLMNSKTQKENILVLKSVHPSPLSASRGFFGNFHFKKINEWLYKKDQKMIDWSVVPGRTLKEVVEKNSKY